MAQNMEVFILGNFVPYCHAFQEVAKRCRVYLDGGFADYVHLANSVWRRSVPGVLRDTKVGRKLQRLILLQSDQLALQDAQSLVRSAWGNLSTIPRLPLFMRACRISLIDLKVMVI